MVSGSFARHKKICSFHQTSASTNSLETESPTTPSSNSLEIEASNTGNPNQSESDEIQLSNHGVGTIEQLSETNFDEGNDQQFVSDEMQVSNGAESNERIEEAGLPNENYVPDQSLSNTESIGDAQTFVLNSTVQLIKTKEGQNIILQQTVHVGDVECLLIPFDFYQKHMLKSSDIIPEQ